MAEIKDIFVGQFGLVATVKTNASLGDASAVDLIIKFPDIDFTAIAYDDSASVKYTDESNRANGIDKDDMTLLPSAPIQLGDAYYIGATGRFKGINFDISQDGVGTWELDYEYWNGSSWGTLSTIVDNTNDFMEKGLRSIIFDIPTDWATIDINDQTDELYFIRIVVSTADTDPTQQPLGAVISLSPVSLTGTVTNPSAQADRGDGLPDDNFGEFTATIPDGVFEFEGTYFMQAKVTVGSSGIFYGKTTIQPVKKLFGQ